MKKLEKLAILRTEFESLKGKFDTDTFDLQDRIKLLETEIKEEVLGLKQSLRGKGIDVVYNIIDVEVTFCYPNEENMSPGEMEHHRWEHNLLSAESVAFLRSMPYRIDFSSEGFDISVMHSCMDRNGHFSGSKKNPSESDLLDMFADEDSDIILYGHDHARNICKSDKLYINVGSLGCPSRDRNIARAGVLTIESGNAGIETIDVVYNVDEVIHQIDMINYPEADIIKKYFYGL